jgi:hypothetical protein
MADLSRVDGTKWNGAAELWLDPPGDQAIRSDCTLSVEGNVVRYTWSHESKPHEGSITLGDDGADFVDTFHSPEPMKLGSVAAAKGLFQVQGVWGPERDWGWRIGLYLRPTDELVLLMTVITPWGEEGRAVRMVFRRA